MKEQAMSFDQIKLVLKTFRQSINPHGQVGTEKEWVLGESLELFDASTKNEIASECADVIFHCINIIERQGMCVEDVLTKKLERNLNKYPIGEYNDLLATGMTSGEVQEIYRNKWDRGWDKNYE